MQKLSDNVTSLMMAAE